MEEKFYDVILEKKDKFHSPTVRVITEAYGLSDAEANKIVLNAPSTVRKNLSKEDAEFLVNRFKTIGAEASMKESEISGTDNERFSVVLENKSKDMTETIKVLRKIFDLTLLQGKNMYDGAPCTIKKNLSKEDAEAIKARLIAVGATVEIKQNSLI